MKIINLMEVISAAHCTKYIESPFPSRGGLFLIGPPGQLKSTIIKLSLIEYPDTLLLSDLNVSSLSALRESLIGGRYSTLGFGEFEKLYKRNPASASNLEAHLQMMVEEGFDKTSFEDPRMMTMTARVLLIGGITPTCYVKRFLDWQNSGFLRRFLWVSYKLANPEAILKAIHEWKPLDFGKMSFKVPANRNIPFKVAREKSLWLESLLQHQPAKETPLIVLKKIFCVLEWRYGSKRATEIMKDFSGGLSKSGAEIYL